MSDNAEGALPRLSRVRDGMVKGSAIAILLNELLVLATLDPILNLPDVLFMNIREPKEPIWFVKPHAVYFLEKQNCTLSLPPDRIGIHILQTSPVGKGGVVERKIYIYGPTVAGLRKTKAAWTNGLRIFASCPTMTSVDMDAMTGQIKVPPPPTPRPRV